MVVRGCSLGEYTAAEFNATFGGRPSTRDDVPRTNDGEPLDTIDKVKAFIGQLNASRRLSAADSIMDVTIPRGRLLASYADGEYNARFVGGARSTKDDVPRTNDGEPLDTVEKVRAFIEQLAAERAASETAGIET